VFPKYTDIVANKEHCKELLQEMERERLVRVAPRSRRDRPGVWHALADWMRAHVLHRRARRVSSTPPQTRA
jgi:hypothetical protein